MGKVTENSVGGRVASSDRAAALIDEIRRHERTLGADQARRAQLMIDFADTRRRLDQHRIGEFEATGGDARYTAGEFAVTELSLAVAGSKYHIQRTTAMARRLQDEAPDVWDSWCAGEIDQDKAVRINRALRRLVRDESKKLLNQLVVKVAPHKTPELLGRWLNHFIAEIEPDETDERLRRSFEDRYVSIRPDIDGISFLHAALSCVDAAAIDQLLSALAAAADPDDTRTHAQRRADALVDVLCGRVSNGCHIRWDTNTDTDDHLDDPDHGIDLNVDEQPADPSDAADPGRSGREPGCGGSAFGNRAAGTTDTADSHRNTNARNGENDNRNDGDVASDDAADRPESDWEQAATAFRPEPHSPEHSDAEHSSTNEDLADSDAASCDNAQSEKATDPAADNQPSRTPPGSWQLTPCPGDHRQNPLPVHIGIVISAASLFGYSNTPGQLQDRSSLVAAEHVRRLAAQPGTLFHRLITDDAGNLLDVTELGRFPSRKLGIAIDYRDGTCTSPTCHTPTNRCDCDHVIPHPDGPTSATNLKNACRPEHRAKTHGGHQTSRTGPHTTTWTTPTGHTYESTDPPLPVEPLPVETLPVETLPPTCSQTRPTESTHDR